MTIMKYPKRLKLIWSDGGQMLTYSFEDRGDEPLYEYLYIQIKNDIKDNTIKQGDKLPSKRALAKHLDISTITVENAYSQLVAEGYIYSVPRSGFYVNEIALDDFGIGYDESVDKKLEPYKTNTSEDKIDKFDKSIEIMQEKPKEYFIDFVSNSTLADNFPFSIWSKLMRETMSKRKNELMTKSPSTGVYELRSAIVDYLYEFRGMEVSPEQIVVGAGTEYLYGLIIQLLGYDKKYAVEDPGYQKVSHIYHANNVECVHIPLDDEGINIESLSKSGADILHITPSHHFPTGLVTPINRRIELLTWASESDTRYIIEDDYDSEFRLKGRPIPAFQSIDKSEKVIYINTFSKTLTSTIRISYMVLPKSLIKKYSNELGFYACTVSNFEQYTLARFIKEGYFEKHINRMRTYYKNIRNEILDCIKRHVSKNKVNIMEENAGLHFLLEVETDLTDKEIVDKGEDESINLSCLSEYYYDKTRAKNHTLVINYSGVEEDNIEKGVEKLFEIF